MTQTLDILERLIGFDTVSAKPNLNLVEFVQDFLASRGFVIGGAILGQGSGVVVLSRAA